MATINPINNAKMSNRILGMSSGMDTETIVKGMLQYDKFRLEREIRNRTLAEWKQEAFTKLNTDLREFRNKYMSILSPDNMLGSAPYNKFIVEKTGEYKDAVTITGGEGAVNGTVSVDYILQLASGAKAESAGGVSKSGGQLSDSNNTKLKDLNFARELEPLGGKIAFSINGEVFEFSMDDTLGSMMSKINGNEKAGVTMSYSRLTDKFTIETKQTGAQLKDGALNSVWIVNIKGNAFGEDGAFGISGGTYVNGKNAVLSINGTEISRSSNQFTLDGISYTLNDTFNTAKTESVRVRASVTRDIEGTFEKIKGFVKAYNELYDTLYKSVSERKTKNEKTYTPLTDEEKELLSEEQLKNWEAIAKKGLLNGDAGIQSVLNQMRGALYEKVSAAGLSPAEIGLKTGAWDTYGRITLDETRLRDALNRDPQGVMEVFTAAPPEEGSTEGAGFLNRLADIINNYSTGANTTTIQSLNRTVSDLDKKVADLEDRMAELEERYYNKFAALEAMMTKLQSQSTWIGNNMGL